MTALQRRVTLAVSLIVGLTFLISAGLTFLIEPMSEDLSLDDETVTLVLAVPSIASLLVIFIAGQLGDRLGHRRTLIAASVGFALGGVVLGVAQESFTACIGLALCGGTATAMQIVALGLLQQTVPDGKARIAAFTTFGMVYPLAYLVFPVVTAGALEIVAWRWIPAVWAIAGVVICLLATTLLQGGEARKPIGEWLTPLLAGVALAGAVRFLDDLGHSDAFATRSLVGVAAGIVAGIACAVLVRRSARASFTLRPIKGSLIRVLLMGVAFVSMVGSLTYVTLALEYLYDFSALQAALALVPAQAGAVLGAKVIAGRAIRRWGIGRAGRHLMIALGISMLPLLLVQTSMPAWYVVACATAFSTVALASVTVLNTDVMGHAPSGGTGPVSSFRGAASSIGSALGVVVLGTSIISAVTMDAGASEVSAQQLEQLAAGLRIDGVLGSVIPIIGWLALSVVERRRCSGGRGTRAL